MRQFTPSFNYPGLRRQFHALCSLVNALEQRMAIESREQQQERVAIKLLDSERAANERLTAELEISHARVRLLELEVERLQKLQKEAIE